MIKYSQKIALKRRKYLHIANCVRMCVRTYGRTEFDNNHNVKNFIESAHERDK